MNVIQDTYLPDILHDISQALLGPVMIIIIGLIVLSLFLLGQFIAEIITERRHFRQDTPAIINKINNANYENIAAIIIESPLLRFQKASLIMVACNMGLPEEALLSLASSQLEEVEARYKRRIAVTDTISKVAPMLGLMGTLIPLGPGIVAMGQNDISTLSSSLLVAFDATVCGLVVAVFSLVISKVRSLWYAKYTSTLESLMNCVIEQAEIARKEGVVLAADYIGNPLVDFDVKNGKPEAACAAGAGAAGADGAGTAGAGAAGAGADAAVAAGADAAGAAGAGASTDSTSSEA